jgi:hypothetical protein
VTDQYTPEPARRRPGRPSNAELAERELAVRENLTARQVETKQRRRRREGLGADRNLKLHVPEGLKDKNFVYRWVNDQPGRVRQLTVEDDWDVVQGMDPDPTKTTAEGTVVKRTVDKGSGHEAVLLRKPREFYEDDKAQEQKLLDARDETMRKGALNTPDGLTGPESYVPGGRNQIARG